MEKEEQEDRLERVEKLFARKKHYRNQLVWVRYNPLKEYKFELQNAEEDFEWMIYEIKRLRKENAQYKEFIDTIRRQMEEEIGRV